MKIELSRSISGFALILSSLSLQLSTCRTQGTAFTYQGRRVFHGVDRPKRFAREQLDRARLTNGAFPPASNNSPTCKTPATRTASASCANHEL